jgi:hypothetical protein
MHMHMHMHSGMLSRKGKWLAVGQSGKSTNWMVGNVTIAFGTSNPAILNARLRCGGYWLDIFRAVRDHMYQWAGGVCEVEIYRVAGLLLLVHSSMHHKDFGF